jgi:integrase/recombinase XerD
MEMNVPFPAAPRPNTGSSTKSFFRWLNQYGVLLIDPAEKVLQRSAVSPLPQVLSDNEYQAALLAADRHRRSGKPDARPYTLLNLLLTTGVKKSECLGIHINHFDLDSKNGPIVFIRYASPANLIKNGNSSWIRIDPCVP